MKLITFAFLLLLCVGVSIPTWGQSTVVMETLTVTAGSVSTDSQTEMDYNTGLWYCAGADAFLSVNGSISQSGTGYGGSANYQVGGQVYYICNGNHSSNTASFTMNASTAANTNYELQTNHWLYPAWYEEDCVDGVCNFAYWIDEYGYSTLSAKQFSGSGTVTAPGTYTESQSDSYYIASTYLYATSSTHVSVLKDNVGYPAVCGTGPAVWVRQTQVQLVTGSDLPITTNQAVAESFSSLTSNTCTPNYGQPSPSACAATSSGVFLDTQAVAGNPNNSSGFCVSETPAGCGYSLTSTWAACGSGLTNNVWTSPRIVHNNGNTMNGNASGFAQGTQLYP
jgi:hypothetical protein